MRYVVLGFVLGGCYIRPDGPNKLRDCAGITFPAMWDEEHSIPDMEGDPAMTADETELFYVVNANQSGGYDWDVHRAVRSRPGDAFLLDGRQSFNDAGTNDTDVSITADGLLVLWASMRTTETRLYFAQRPTRGGAWSAAAPVGGLDGLAIAQFSLAPDGSWLYYREGNGLRRATRRTAGPVYFELDPESHGETAGFPALASDELELYSISNGIYRATRATLTEDFVMPLAPVISDEADPFLATDELLVTASNGIKIRRRACRPVD